MIDYNPTKWSMFHFIVFPVLECRNRNAFVFKIMFREIILLDATAAVSMNASSEVEKWVWIFFLESQLYRVQIQVKHLIFWNE